MTLFFSNKNQTSKLNIKDIVKHQILFPFRSLPHVAQNIIGST
jgi:hypothetical protein